MPYVDRVLVFRGLTVRYTRQFELRTIHRTTCSRRIYQIIVGNSKILICTPLIFFHRHKIINKYDSVSQEYERLHARPNTNPVKLSRQRAIEYHLIACSPTCNKQLYYIACVFHVLHRKAKLHNHNTTRLLQKLWLLAHAPSSLWRFNEAVITYSINC